MALASVQGRTSSMVWTTSRRASPDESEIWVNASECQRTRLPPTTLSHYGSQLARLRRCLSPVVDDLTDEHSDDRVGEVILPDGRRGVSASPQDSRRTRRPGQRGGSTADR